MFHFLAHRIMQLNRTGDRGGAYEQKSHRENHSCFICHRKVFWQFLAEQSNLLQRKQHGNKQQNQHFLLLSEQTGHFYEATHACSTRTVHPLNPYTSWNHLLLQGSLYASSVSVCEAWSPAFGSGSINKSLREELLSTCLPFVRSSRQNEATGRKNIKTQ